MNWFYPRTDHVRGALRLKAATVSWSRDRKAGLDEPLAVREWASEQEPIQTVGVLVSRF